MEKFEYKGTPGPWAIKKFSYGDGSFTIDNPDLETFVAHSIGSLGNGVEKANAHLIAAAPDLLESLIGLTDLAERMQVQLFGPDGKTAAMDSAHPIAKAKAAIAKALNQQP